LEAFCCLGSVPGPTDTVVDLGASPGGWTGACLLVSQPRSLIAVDRSVLDPAFMTNSVVTFVKGDAFAYRPPHPVDWMMCDVIAKPARILELVETWCRHGLAKTIVATVKFQGETPSWEIMDKAIVMGESHGYYNRAKHFFNNKNEVTLMFQKHTTEPNQTLFRRQSSYRKVWPIERIA
jgi:23S rRNA (cytidine2498-2'-O)-methyltransferase